MCDRECRQIAIIGVRDKGNAARISFGYHKIFGISKGWLDDKDLQSSAGQLLSGQWLHNTLSRLNRLNVPMCLSPKPVTTSGVKWFSFSEVCPLIAVL
jgi:hypothetical protein